MYARINGRNYRRLKSISFAPETDLTGNSIPINEISLDIVTEETISVGQYLFFYDDLNNLWCKYWIIYAERIDTEIVRVRSQSQLRLLERSKMPAVMYASTSVSTIIAAIFDNVGSGSYSLASSLANKTVTGFCPEQTSRERLQWVCFCIGAYIKSAFTDKIEILPIDETATHIPIEKTYWKPSVTHRDYIYAINVIEFSFTPGQPTNTGEWVTDGTNYWQVTRSTRQLVNPDFPSGIPRETVTYDSVYLVNRSNSDDILMRLASTYFKRDELDTAIIANADYEPGQKVVTYKDEMQAVTGHIEKMNFSFGVQAKATLHITPIEDVDTAKLTITYMYNNKKLGQRKYYLPVGYTYNFSNPYLDLTDDSNRYVYRPLNASATGTIQDGANTNTQNYEIALLLQTAEKILHIRSVTEIEIEEGVITIG